MQSAYDLRTRLQTAPGHPSGLHLKFPQPQLHSSMEYIIENPEFKARDGNNMVPNIEYCNC